MKTLCKETKIQSLSINGSNVYSERGELYSIIIDSESFSLIEESCGNKFLVLSSYLEQEAGQLRSPYDNGTLIFDEGDEGYKDNTGETLRNACGSLE